MIKRIPVNDKEQAFLLFRETIAKMHQLNIFQWSDHYPNNEVISNDIKEGHAFGYYDNSKLCGYIVLNELSPPEYEDIRWGIAISDPLIIHRLAVLPACQKQGIAKKLIDFAEDFAVQNHYKTIRVDTYSKNPIALKLYEKLEYRPTGTVQFDRGTFNCFEKIF